MRRAHREREREARELCVCVRVRVAVLFLCHFCFVRTAPGVEWWGVFSGLLRERPGGGGAGSVCLCLCVCVCVGGGGRESYPPPARAVQAVTGPARPVNRQPDCGRPRQRQGRLSPAAAAAAAAAVAAAAGYRRQRLSLCRLPTSVRKALPGLQVGLQVLGAGAGAGTARARARARARAGRGGARARARAGGGGCGWCRATGERTRDTRRGVDVDSACSSRTGRGRRGGHGPCARGGERRGSGACGYGWKQTPGGMPLCSFFFPHRARHTHTPLSIL